MTYATGTRPLCNRCGYSGGGVASPASQGPPAYPPQYGAPPASPYGAPGPYGSNPYGAPPPYSPYAQGYSPYAPQARTSGAAITSMVLGIVGCCIWIFPFIGPFLTLGAAITAIILAVSAMKAVSRDPMRVKGKGMAVAGLVLGIINVLIGLLLVVGLLAGEGIMHELCKDPQQADNPSCEQYRMLAPLQSPRVPEPAGASVVPAAGVPPGNWAG